MQRSAEIAVQVVHNKNGWNVGIRVNSTPYMNLGPYDERITLVEALQLAAVHARMDPNWDIKE